MATPTPQPPSSQPAVLTLEQKRAQLIHYTSLSALIVCPIILALPPRRLNLMTIGLLGCIFAGGNEISKEYTGTSMLERLGKRMESMSPGTLPPKAQEMQIRLREEKARREAVRLGGIEEMRRKGEELARRTEEESKASEERGLLKKVWMGSEGEDWKQKRDQKEKEALEEGKGYGGMILDQIWEVWNWGRDKAEEVKNIDEKVVQEKKEGKK